jgi:iron complex outermembrane receptor protein
MGSFTLNDFKFGEYQAGNSNFRGNKLTGIPDQVFTAGLQSEFLNHFYFNLNFNYTGGMPLNDVNTVYASAYRLWQSKIGWKTKVKRKLLDTYFLVDNISDEQYSLGNDINAFGGRFFNPAPGRNILLGIALQL